MKFENEDAQYLAARREAAERLGLPELWDTVDHWPLYAGTGNLARVLAVYDLLRGVQGVPGDIAEFGVWRGANLLFMAKAMRILDPHGPKRLYGFDSFEGLREFADQDGEARRVEGDYRGDPGPLAEMIRLHGLDDEVELVPGAIEESLPAFLAKRPELSLSLIYCDTDLYASTNAILSLLHPRLMAGGIFVLDEWNYENFPGEGIAANEFLREHPDAYTVESPPRTRQPSLVLRKR